MRCGKVIFFPPTPARPSCVPPGNANTHEAAVFAFLQRHDDPAVHEREPPSPTNGRVSPPAPISPETTRSRCLCSRTASPERAIPAASSSHEVIQTTAKPSSAPEWRRSGRAAPRPPRPADPSRDRAADCRPGENTRMSSYPIRHRTCVARERSGPPEPRRAGTDLRSSPRNAVSPSQAPRLCHFDFNEIVILANGDGALTQLVAIILM